MKTHPLPGFENIGRERVPAPPPGTRVLGLDLSLRSSGWVLLPGDWGLDWARIVVGGEGYGLPKDASQRDRAVRCECILRALVEFIEREQPTDVWLEQYAYSSELSHAHSIGELGGVVKRELMLRRLPFQSIAAASARKVLGKQPRSGGKVWAAEIIYRAGGDVAKAWNEDQVDAFVVANAGLLELGGTGIVVPEAA